MEALLQQPMLFATIGGVTLALVAALWRLWIRLMRSERERRRAADELNRRLSELFSLQELSYVLSDSLELDRIVEQVVRYAVRFLDAQGALLALAGEAPGDPLRIAAAEGTLVNLRGRVIPADDPGLVVRSTSREHLELVRNSGGDPMRLVSDVEAASAAAVPMRAHGVVVGTLVIADPREGVFVANDLRLLSTLATHAAVVIANARFFEMVRRAKEQWETAFDALSEGIAVVDHEGRVRRANRALAGLLGAPLPNVIGTHLCHALLGKSHALHGLLEAARRGDHPSALVARSERLGAGGTVRVNAAPIASATRDQSVVVLVEDVTDQQAMETQLIQSEKLAAVGQLVSGVAHELNNPLTSIAGLSEFLLEQKEISKKDRGHLKVIHEQAERAGRIVGNLLTFARKGPAERTAVDLNDVIQRTLQLMEYDLKLKDIEVRRDLRAVLPDVLGDRHNLQQVVLNLVTNAAQAVAENGKGRARAITVSTWFDDHVHLRVADTGPGLTDLVAQNVFTPFFTTKEPGKGTGLGLSITYSIVENHGGRITVERPSGGGAAFRVDLPPVPAGTLPPAPPPPPPPLWRGPAPGPGTIVGQADDPARRRRPRRAADDQGAVRAGRPRRRSRAQSAARAGAGAAGRVRSHPGGRARRDARRGKVVRRRAGSAAAEPAGSDDRGDGGCRSGDRRNADAIGPALRAQAFQPPRSAGRGDALVGRRYAVVGLGGPAVGSEVHRTTRREPHAFAEQQSPLQHGAMIVTREGDAARRVDDAPPGHVVLFGQRRQRPADGARGTGPTRQTRHDAVRRHSPLRDVPHDAIDAVIEGVHDA